MPPNSCHNARFSEKMTSEDNPIATSFSSSLRLLRTLGINRPNVTCRNCRARLNCNARIIREHLQFCVSANLVMVANSEEFVRNNRNRRNNSATTTTIAGRRNGSGRNRGIVVAAAVADDDGGGGVASASRISKPNAQQPNVNHTNNIQTTTMPSSSTKITTTSPEDRYTSMIKHEPSKELLKPLQLPQRILTGPGPSNCSQRVLRALNQQVLGHMHPEIFQLMGEIKSGLRYAFQTTNELTLALSASGHAGMEAAIGNLLERDENMLVVDAGLWGERAADMASRLGIHVDHLKTKLGVAFTLDELEDALKRYKPRAVFVIHSESSTGLKQPLEGIGDLVHRHNGLLIVDTVASLGAEPFFADAWGVDVVYTGSQKVLGAPPGITPMSFSPLAVQKIRSRKTPVPVYYWDMTLLGRYWNCFGPDNGPRIYHHTISAPLIYALRESLAQLAEEGLKASWARHAAVTEKFHDGLRKRGDYGFFVAEPRHRLRTVTSILLPEGVDAGIVVRYAMERYNVEISGGLGRTVGKIIRIGLMGVNATSGHVDLVLRVLDEGTRYARTQVSSNL